MKRLRMKLGRIKRLPMRLKQWNLEKNAENYFISFPKSGRTWVRLMLAKYNGYLGGEFDLDFVKLNGKSIVFSHNFNDECNLVGKRVCFLIRDPRDIVVSYYFHMKNRELLFDGSLSEFIRDKDFGLKQIKRYVDELFDLYSNCGNHKFEDVYLVYYERLCKDTEKEFANIIRFFGVVPDMNIVKRVVNECEFDKMRKMELEDVFNNPILGVDKKVDEEFLKVRKGKIGGYKDYFDKKDLEFMESVLQ